MNIQDKWSVHNDNGIEESLALLQKPLGPEEVTELRKCHGYNVIGTGKRKPWYRILFTAIFHPFNILLAILAGASAATDDLNTMYIMIVMVTISSAIRFQQEWKSYREALSLLTLVSKNVKVIRYSDSDSNNPHIVEIDIPTEELLPGDWVKLEPGNLVPADIVIVKSKDLFISQASLTGEAIPVEKYAVHRECSEHPEVVIDTPNDWGSTEMLIPNERSNTCGKFLRGIFGLQTNLATETENQENRLILQENLDRPDMCYMGTSVVTGTAIAIVKATGSSTYFGIMAKKLAKSGPQNAFQLGVRRISWIFFLTMSCLVPPVLLLQGFLNKDWSAAFLFAISVAVGLTPEMLPMIVNTTLAKGAYQLAVRKCVVKSLDAVVNLGGMNILCTDKTGTLTQSKVTLNKYIDPVGHTSELTLRLTYLNSCFQSVQKNPMDAAVLQYHDMLKFQKSVLNSDVVPFDISGIAKVDEIPFDFQRRRTSVILYTNDEEMFLICKGATDEMLSVCTKILNQNSTSLGNNILPQDDSISEMTDETKANLRELSEKLSEAGLRLLGVAYKKLNGSSASSSTNHYGVSYENDMIFAGFVAFLDPPKKSTKGVIKKLLQNNVHVKVLTGDSSAVCKKICQEIDLPVNGIITSDELEGLDDKEVSDVAERATIFSKLTPIQKADVVRALKRNGHIVGFLGDGINDSLALTEADVGISVDSGADVAKESADIILLEKSLGVVGDGVIIGRSTFGNTLKYIVMAVSSNFGNVFSILVASSWLPFLPMLSIHLLAQNLLYDISQIAIPWDHMDREFLAVPHRWSMKNVLRFMVFMGPWSSVFDITTFLYMYFYFGIQKATDDVTLFQTTWFTVGLLTQTLIVHMIRTPKIPFIQSRASTPFTIMTVIIMSIGLAVPYIPGLRDWLQMTPLHPMVYPYIAAALISYAIVAQLAKVIYIKIFKEWF